MRLFGGVERSSAPNTEVLRVLCEMLHLIEAGAVDFGLGP